MDSKPLHVSTYCSCLGRPKEFLRITALCLFSPATQNKSREYSLWNNCDLVKSTSACCFGIQSVIYFLSSNFNDSVCKCHSSLVLELIYLYKIAPSKGFLHRETKTDVKMCSGYSLWYEADSSDYSSFLVVNVKMSSFSTQVLVSFSNFHDGTISSLFSTSFLGFLANSTDYLTGKRSQSIMI